MRERKRDTEIHRDSIMDRQTVSECGSIGLFFRKWPKTFNDVGLEYLLAHMIILV